MGFLTHHISSTIKVGIVLSLIIFQANIVRGENTNNDFERSSICMMLLKHRNLAKEDILYQVYSQMPFPERFNNHNLGVKYITIAETNFTDNAEAINKFCQQVNLGQRMVSKWFDRDKETGSFNTDLIFERGKYNATFTQLQLADATIRGRLLFGTAGEELINQTYLLVSDITYQTLAPSSSPFSIVKPIAGFRVSITSYLFQLHWDDEVANTFYTRYYTEYGLTDTLKVMSYLADKSTFKMDYIDKVTTTDDEKQRTELANPPQTLLRLCTRILDYNIAQLQHIYAPFRIKATLDNIEPLQAHIGKKEDVKENSLYEVLLRQMNEDGSIEYKRIGIIRPQKGQIWDNRYQTESQTTDEAGLTCTTFEAVSGGPFFQGLLIREINNDDKGR